MKKIFLYAAGLLLAATTTTTAQVVNTVKAKKNGSYYTSIGPAIGFGHNWVGNMAGTSRFMPSGGIGLSVVYARTEHWGLGGQLNVTSEGYNVDYGNYNAMVTPLYLRVPLRAYYFFGSYKDVIRPKLYAGPTIGVKLAEQNNSDPMYLDATMAQRTGSFRTLDLGINVGAGLNIQLAKATWLNLDLVYFQGLMDVVDDAAGKYNVNHNLGLNVGILFGIR